MNHAITGTLARWLTGPRVAGLPAPAAMPAPRLSFEFFPPKTDKLEEQLWACIRRFPDIVAATHGRAAGGRAGESGEPSSRPDVWRADALVPHSSHPRSKPSGGTRPCGATSGAGFHR